MEVYEVHILGMLVRLQPIQKINGETVYALDLKSNFLLKLRVQVSFK